MKASTFGPWLDTVKACDRRRGHMMLPLSVLRSLPPLRSTDGQGYDAVARLRLFFGGAGVAYVTELDPETGEAFGWCDLGHGGGELGYLSLVEYGTAIGQYGTASVERDCLINGKSWSAFRATVPS